MNRDFLVTLARGHSLENTKKRLIEKISAEADKQKTVVESDYNDAVLVAAGLRANEGSAARIVAEAFLKDAMEEAQIDEQDTKPYTPERTIWIK